MFVFMLLPFITIVCYVGQISSHQTAPEPTCTSGFDYESKILERIVMVEHRMNLTKERLRKEAENIRSDSTGMTETFTQLEHSLENQLETKLKEFEQLARELKEEKNNKQLELDQLSRELKENQRTELSEYEVVTNEIKSYITEELQNVTSQDLEDNLDKLGNDIQQAYEDLHTYYINSIEELQAKGVFPKPAVAFYVSHPFTDSPGTNALLIFRVQVYYQNFDYDMRYGYFTATTSGAYLFAVQFCAPPNEQINFRIFVNDKHVSETTVQGSDESSHCSSTTAIVKLKPGDTVSVRTGENTSDRVQRLSSFSNWSTFLGVRINSI